MSHPPRQINVGPLTPEQEKLKEQIIESYYARTQPRVPSPAPINGQVAQQHVRHHHRHKANRFWRGVFNVAKIVAVGATAVFGGPLLAPVVAGLGGAGAAVATGAACAVADAAIQGVGVQLGCQDKFSVNEVLETTVSAGLGSGAASAGMIPKVMTSAAGAAITQAAEVQIGTREDLDPKAVVTQGVSSVVSSVVSQVITPVANGALQEHFPDAVKTVGEENAALATNGLVNATANSAVQSIALNSPMSLESVLMNTLGSTLGTKVGAVINDALYKYDQADSTEFDLDKSESTDTTTVEDNDPTIGEMGVIDETANVQLPTEQETHEFLGMLKQTIEQMKSVSFNMCSTSVEIGSETTGKTTDANLTIGATCNIDEIGNVQLPTDQEMQNFFEMVKQTMERMSHASPTALTAIDTTTPILAKPDDQGNASDVLASDASSDGIEVIPPVIVTASDPHSMENEESFYDSLSGWQKAGLSIGIVMVAVALLPEEVGATLLFGLGRLGMALMPEVGALPGALAVDAMAGEAIAGTAAGAGAINFAAKFLSKMGMFSQKVISADIMMSEQVAKNELTSTEGVESIVNKAIAKYPKQVEQYSNLTEKQLEKAIKSHEKQIALHEDKLKNPENHVPNWNEISSQHQQSLITRWNNDIARHQSYLEIAAHILKNFLERAPKNGR